MSNTRYLSGSKKYVAQKANFNKLPKLTSFITVELPKLTSFVTVEQIKRHTDFPKLRRVFLI